MPRAMDHLVIPSRDLAQLAEGFSRLGFKVGTRNRHPWGTENHIIQFRSSFLELLGFADDFAAPAPQDPAFPFAGFLHTRAERHPTPGAAMTVLRATDAAADVASFSARGIGLGRMLPFSRTTRGPDGTDRTVAFTIAFAEAPAMPDLGFFTCEQHRPENFWNPAAQVHANGATDIVGLVIVADRLDDPAAFLSSFADAGAVEENGGRTIPLDGGRIELLTPAGFARRYGEPCAAAPSARIAAMAIGCAEPPRLADALARAGLAGDERDGRLICRPGATPDTCIIFETC